MGDDGLRAEIERQIEDLGYVRDDTGGHVIDQHAAAELFESLVREERKRAVGDTEDWWRAALEKWADVHLEGAEVTGKGAFTGKYGGTPSMIMQAVVRAARCAPQPAPTPGEPYNPADDPAVSVPDLTRRPAPTPCGPGPSDRCELHRCWNHRARKPEEKPTTCPTCGSDDPEVECSVDSNPLAHAISGDWPCHDAFHSQARKESD